MKVTIPDKLAEAIESKDITVDFTEFLLARADKEIRTEQEKIAGLQKKHRVADLKQFLKKRIKGKDHSFETDEDLMAWDSAETIIKNRYQEISKLRGFINAYNKKLSLFAKREG
ncbi:hypothetical protein COT42_08805 [Candidatus Saganbacteria bacterium CG08_land_8_20_14_0_20_45_16]|uniref:Uncharacterized protein n=1 Tax=Candidatus Saganbacteria bacterium CG08_land_8_20_14_0_20_45_16 TaxID=2014293 RepID=A0A2H0XT93_UNCSA|nr:MAG: hypothetical protein COT42_08805 [Candidatus Saganbacteria bacterium CG08_land_8_20_14_0_20_45_16]